MIGSVNSAAVMGIQGYQVRVEVDIARGLRDCNVVGLPDGAIRESIKRVQSAIKNTGFRWPHGRITVNLAPAGQRKDGTGFDLPIALAIILASGQIDRLDVERFDSSVYIGELSLGGEVLAVPGVLPRASLARDLGASALLVPKDNAAEASVVEQLRVIPVSHLADAVAWLETGGMGEPVGPPEEKPARADYPFDFKDVKGQTMAKRGLEIAAGGGHNLLMIGPPGTGKTMLARRLVTILPSMSFEESLETTKVYSVASALPSGTSLVTERPFCAPHFTISAVGLVGGGAGIPKPGQLSLAHNGVLFLDELPEFPRHVLEVMRGPLEDQQITLTRGMTTVTYPSSIMLVASMNPCPCGYWGSGVRECECTFAQIQKYRNRISGPLLDRIDLHTTVASISCSQLMSPADEEPSAAIRARVEAARDLQRVRFEGSPHHCNAEMGPTDLERFCRLDAGGRRLIEQCIDVLAMSARSYSRVLKVARTIADLSGEEVIGEHHVAEAIAFRQLDEMM